ncbi:hypothetical protein ANCCEY_03044 [Ancylostoma ceylanicum]|uniref:Uncharacterized protein n=1 Tax=Ancylostoma ceylanicum TaxID=53326 RepID=A0A0D6M320_9BILA|nr:hypothetical protein ANCCEY_03044 [Ancylostoma ceylanicum]
MELGMAYVIARHDNHYTSFSRQKRSEDEPLPADVYWSLPFNMMIKNQQVFVACHKIYGNLKINQH